MDSWCARNRTGRVTRSGAGRLTRSGAGRLTSRLTGRVIGRLTGRVIGRLTGRVIGRLTATNRRGASFITRSALYLLGLVEAIVNQVFKVRVTWLRTDCHRWTGCRSINNHNKTSSEGDNWHCL